MTVNRQHTRSLREDIQRLAGTMPATDLCRKLGCTGGTLRTIASELGVSTRFGGTTADPDRPGTDDRAVARIDAQRPRTIELRGIVLSAEVHAKLRLEASGRNVSVESLVAKMASMIAIDGLVGAVIGDR